jgi:hypothetical protein
MATVDETKETRQPRSVISPSWCSLIDAERRRDFLAILASLSDSWKGMERPFLIVGALSLVLRERLHFMAMWDIDLLFASEEEILAFIVRDPPPGVRVVHYDDELMRGAQITSFHSAWTTFGKWVNVDCMWRPTFYEFHHRTFLRDGPFVQEVDLEGEAYRLRFPLAHPWDVFIEKVTSPRFEAVVERGDGLHPDVRHVFSLLHSDGERDGFWSYVEEKASSFGLLDSVRKGLQRLRVQQELLGYVEFLLPDGLDRKIGELGR